MESMPKISMLLVEDEKMNRDLYAFILTKKFPEIVLHTAINGRMGLGLFKTHTPDIVITDINMPEMGGVQMIQEIHAIRPDTKFIVLSGTSGKPDLRESTQNGFEIDHYIVKPVVFQELFAAIEQCLGEIAQNQL